ncbi:class I SAM-dependent methyltransferase [bacterium]|nr:class I SAM-dependent methyltransferase [bacterium]
MSNIEKEEKYYDAKEYWEGRAKKYGSSYKGWKAILMSGDKYYYEYVDMIDKRATFNFLQIRPGMKILDVGCGIGRWCIAFAGRGADITGIDISEEMIKLASDNMKKEGLDGNLVVKSSDEMDFPDNSFDIVHCAAVLMHVTDPVRFRKSCENIVRVARPGGQILLKEWAPRKRKESGTNIHIIGRAYHEYKHTVEKEGAFLVREAGVHPWTRLDRAYDAITAKLVPILKRRSECRDESIETKEFMEVNYPGLSRLFQLGRRTLISVSKPVELYLVRLWPFGALCDSRLMLFQKR